MIIKQKLIIYFIDEQNTRDYVAFYFHN